MSLPDPNYNGTIPHIGLGEDKLPPEKEIAEYLLQYRADLITGLDNGEISINISEHELLEIILRETQEEFRTHLRNGISMAYARLQYEPDDDLNYNNSIEQIINRFTINMSMDQNRNIRELTSEECEGKMVIFSCEVANFTNGASLPKRQEYKCSDCGDITVRGYKEGRKLRCNICNLIMDESFLRMGEMTKRATLREIIFDMHENRSPFEITGDFIGKDANEITTGKMMTVTGMFRSLPLRLEKGKLRREFIPTIQIIGMSERDDGSSDLPNHTLMEKLRNLESDKKLVPLLVNSYAPEVYDKKIEKKACLCSIVGSVKIGSNDKGGVQPMIHLLFVGDADTLKSTIMKYGLNVYGRMKRADSGQITQNGLKAVLMRMPDGNFAVRAGLLVLCDSAVLFLEEFGELKDSMFEELKIPMSEGFITKDGGGINAYEKKARTGIWGSMNPYSGSYDMGKTIHDNLNPPLKPAMITRFDGIFVFTTKQKEFNKEEINKCFRNTRLGKPDGLLTDEEMTKYLNYARKIIPIVTDVSLDYIDSYFKMIDDKRLEKEMAVTDIRTKNGVVKFMVALTKLHLKLETDIDCAKESIEIFERSMTTFGLDPKKGEVLAEGDIKKTENGRRTALRLAYDKIKDDDGYVFQDELVDMAFTYDVFRTKAIIIELLGKLSIEGATSEKNNMLYITWI